MALMSKETILDIKSKRVFLDDRFLKICENTCAEMRFYGRLNTLRHLTQLRMKLAGLINYSSGKEADLLIISHFL